MKIEIESSAIEEFPQATRLEWIETNGIGGWASSTVCGVNTRRYHGLLVAAMHPPLGRMVMLSKLEETVEVGGREFELGCNRFPGVIHPQGYRYLSRVEKGYFTQFTYSVIGVCLKKTVACVQGENTTLISYELSGTDEPVLIRLRPLVAVRDYHSLTHENDAISKESRFQNGVLEIQPYGQEPPLFLSVPGSNFLKSPDWYRDFEYEVEQHRGLDYKEDLFSYGQFEVSLSPGARLGIIVSMKDPSRRDVWRLLEDERVRRERLVNRLPVRGDLVDQLTLAADQFLVKRGENMRTVIAGYHWFGDWGRDTMIALPGLTLCTRRFDTAREILQTYSGSARQGLLPNRFPDTGEAPEYNTVDASLWFFVAAFKFWQYTGDDEFLRGELMPVFRSMLHWYQEGTLHGIRVDSDGLLMAGEPGVQLTWMDAKIGDWVVTPRHGKAVEINALWFNALKIYAYFLKIFGESELACSYENKARRHRTRFLEVFYDQGLGYLCDFVDGDHRDASLRPNQIFALSLPFPLIGGKKAASILRLIEQKLYTPFGLRTLAPDHPSFRPYYGGDQYSRDSAYHQGTVWAWLLGPYITAIRRFGGTAADTKARQVIEKFRIHLKDAGVGTVSEIFDATPPYTPRGTISQAWSVGELLRAYLEDDRSSRHLDE